jgi:putative membrane protein
MNIQLINDRRDFIKKSVTGAVALGVSTTILGTLVTPLTSDAASLDNFNPDVPIAHNEKEFRMGVIGPAELSLITSEIAVTKATDRFAKEFAGFEKTEAIAVTGVLKDLNTPVPPMSAKASATLAKIKSTPAGPTFDKVYIKAQLDNHVFLRDLAESYLTNAAGKPGAAENQTKHLATLALAVFKEHVAITTDILTKLNS